MTDKQWNKLADAAKLPKLTDRPFDDWPGDWQTFLEGKELNRAAPGVGFYRDVNRNFVTFRGRVMCNFGMNGDVLFDSIVSHRKVFYLCVQKMADLLDMMKKYP